MYAVVGTDVDVMMKNLSMFVMDTIKNSDIKPNLNKCQLAALKSIRNRDNLHIAVSDKCGDFVVSTANAYKSLTIQHIKSNVDVYKWIPPTRQINGESRQVKCPTEIIYKLQINNKRDFIEMQCNTTWREIVNERGIEKRTAALFFSHNTSLPTLYTLLKTHKIPPEVNISTKRLEELKVRPIISCSGSPTERLATLVTRLITPLLNFIPCHLINIHQHLKRLSDIEPSSLEGLKFYTADVTALFTNVNVERCIGYVLDLAEQHWEEVETYGLKLVDLQKLLEVVMGNSYFTFNGRLYVQIYGTFIGCSACPPCAIITVYWLEKQSIYIDPYYIQNPISLFYGRYVDDSGSLARSKEEAKTNCDMISNKDIDGKIRWEVEYPEYDNQYIPFLDTEILIKDNGEISSRYYRKPRNKGITLNYRSHHQMGTKSAVAKNYYKSC